MTASGEKIGILAFGGGCKCAFNVGVLAEACERFPSLAYAQAISGGAINMAKVIADGWKADGLVAHWLQIEKNGAEALFRPWDVLLNFFGMQRVHKRVAELAYELNHLKIARSPTHFEVVTRYRYRDQIRVWSNKEPLVQERPELLWDIVLASMSMPSVMPPVHIIDDEHSDGFVCSVDHIVAQECDRLFVIVNDHAKNPQEIPAPSRWNVSGVEGGMYTFDFMYAQWFETALANLRLRMGEEKVVVIKPSIAIPTLNIMRFKKGDLSCFIEHGQEVARKAFEA